MIEKRTPVFTKTEKRHKAAIIGKRSLVFLDY